MNKNINTHFYYKIILILLINLIILILIIIKLRIKTGKKIGIVGVRHEYNIGNNLIKYAI